eukprot:TRINITY_DN1179_c2_g2_i1.p1 TRINITY_DN1179_c2_g2~~TRINITY_DN1179_c2_g2_i1.p1  ORF type:complete len:354 (-),score=42.41 TRINITY_DN1179_c2_g2_i1:235-1296(-)
MQPQLPPRTTVDHDVQQKLGNTTTIIYDTPLVETASQPTRTLIHHEKTKETSCAKYAALQGNRDACHDEKFGLLPSEVKILLASFLDYRSLATLSSLNKEWYIIGSTDNLWKAQFEHYTSQIYGSPNVRIVSIPQETVSWKEKMKESILSTPFKWIPTGRERTNDFKPIPGTIMKVALLGMGGAGKTAFIKRWISDIYTEEYDPTVEDTYLKEVVIDDVAITFQVWDTSGVEEFSALRDQCIRSCDCFILVYAITHQTTFNDLRNILARIHRIKNTTHVPMVLVGCRCDNKDRQVRTEEGLEFAKSLNIPFFETSARNNENVDLSITQLIWESMPRQDVTPGKKKKEEKCLVQ